MTGMQAVVLAGGRASRLGELALRRPKTLMSVAGQPFAHHQLTWLESEGVTDVVYCVGHLGSQIEDFVGDGARWGLAVSYSHDGPMPLGTGGALSRALADGHLAEQFLVVYGDSYLSIDLAELQHVAATSPHDAVMAVIADDDERGDANVIFEDGRLVRYDKSRPVDLAARMRHIDYGVSAIRRTVVETMVPPDDFVDLSATLRDLSVAGRLGGHEVHDRFYEVGTPDGLAELDQLLRASNRVGPVSFTSAFLSETTAIIKQIDEQAVEAVALGLAEVRERGGRLFILGVGGSAANAGHAVNDFRKLCGFEAYAPTDNVAELTARTNDDGWNTVFSSWLTCSRLRADDALLVLSVGGGSIERDLSVNIVGALDVALSVGASIFGIVGPEGGHTARSATAVVHIPGLVPGRVTPHTEGLTAVIWHLLVTHPALQLHIGTWEAGAAPSGRSGHAPVR